ncbi:MAG: cation-translocating P-type ATPase [Planctomycetes bacterium]|nr:cation-translocating P-type ATPase [Planctomycetota bacterium]
MRTLPMKSAAHSLSADAILAQLGTDPRRGLSSTQVAEARRQYGVNELDTAPPEPFWRKFLQQLNDPVIWLLIGAAIVSGAVGEWTDATAIVAIVLLNAVIGFVQEERAGRALTALQKLAAPVARVIRDGRLQSIGARELVPADLIDIEAGDHIPADARLVSGAALHVHESALTGESTPVIKDSSAVLAADLTLADRRNMVYQGTVPGSGKGRAVVVAIGMQTELGRVAGLLETYQVGPTPLQHELAGLGRTLTLACTVIVVIIFLLESWRGRPFVQSFLLSVSLAVAAVPEGLPAVVTFSLALGLQRMVRRNVLIRKLPSVETLGAVTVICTDKTGTLTRNELTVREIVTASHRYFVTGSGYNPHGEFRRETPAGEKETVSAPDDLDLTRLVLVADRCNHAQLVPAGDDDDNWQVMGDATDGALRVVVRKAGLPEVSPDRRIHAEIPFDSERKAMSLLISEHAQTAVLYTKGAPEVVLNWCVAESRNGQITSLTSARREEIRQSAAEMAARALRVLALAWREHTAGPTELAENELVFAGLVGMLDSPRESAGASVTKCRAAGIRPIMITGDHPATAWAIARELGISQADDRLVTGSELDSLPDTDLDEQVTRISVYARVTAENKLRIVQSWKRSGHIVAMTGDGVNDAPALKAADIGIAMGASGTDVAREAAAMVLTDDNFTSIVDAVEEGRTIYDNILKFLSYLLSCNIGEMLLMLIAILLGWPAPLLPVHLLVINLITDGLPALALALEPPEPGIMLRQPRPAGSSMLSRELLGWILVQGALLAAVGLITFGILDRAHPEEVAPVRTMTFCVVVAAELLRVLAARSQRWTFWQLGPLSNPLLFAAVAVSGLITASLLIVPVAGASFQTTRHAPWEWCVLTALALTPVTAIELAKWIRQKSRS